MQAQKNAPDPYKRSRLLFVVEQALEYFISILIGGAYFARITEAAGIPDDVTGILTSLASFSCVAQLAALTLMRRRSVKRIITVGHTVNQLLFALLYLTPFVPVSSEYRACILAGCLLLGHLISQAIYSPQINWFMELVDDKKRGVFTANKEIFSLLSGMVFTFVMGAIIDRFDAAGNQTGSFILIAVTIFGLCALHTLTLVFSKEKTAPERAVKAEKVSLGELFSNRNLLKVLVIPVLWHIITYSTTPFLGTYQNKELGFSMVFISVISALSAIARSLASRPMGRLADKYSFATMLILCFAIKASSLAVNMFTAPANGHVLFTLYAVLQAMAMAGINSSMINLVYDYVPRRMRVAALALQSILAGIVGFVTTLLSSRLVAYIQKSGNRFLGMNVYAQQVMSAIALIITLLTIVYLYTVVRRIHRAQIDYTPPV